MSITHVYIFRLYSDKLALKDNVLGDAHDLLFFFFLSFFFFFFFFFLGGGGGSDFVHSYNFDITMCIQEPFCET